MAKDKTAYSCAECGYQSVRWLGKCPNCGAWNSFAEEVLTRSRVPSSVRVEPKSLGDVTLDDLPRLRTGIGELDRVLGGGVVPGSAVLVAGEPGVGKSTLLLTVAGRIAESGATVLYVSGEESPGQVKLRAKRIGILPKSLFLLSATELPSIREALDGLKPALVIIDSIQTMFDPDIPSTPGSVTQVRETAQAFLSLAKKTGVPFLLVGHITKEGAIAGPKLLEHVVDVVLSFEGDSRSDLRILRGMKNRFGSTMEIGVFRMVERGLEEVPEAGGLFLQDFRKPQPGAVIFPSQEGSRTILVEIQSLVTPAFYGVPKRSVTGLDYNRVSLILAVLEKKLRFAFGTHDVYVNIGGGIRIDETASDVACACACVASLKEVAPPEGIVFIGELALTGEVRPVSHIHQRLKEAARLGFSAACIPAAHEKDIPKSSLRLIPVLRLSEAVDICLGRNGH